MKALLEAIKTKFDAASTLDSAGDLHFEQVPERDSSGNLISKAYARYLVLGSPVTLYYDTKASLEETRIQFDVWTAGATPGLTIQDAIHGVFDNVVLTLSPSSGSEKNIETTRTFDRAGYEGRDESQDETYRVSVEYVFKVFRLNP